MATCQGKHWISSASRHWLSIIRSPIPLTRHPIAIAIQPVRVAGVSPQHGLRLSLAREVRTVVAVALADVLRGIERAGALSGRPARLAIQARVLPGYAPLPRRHRVRISPQPALCFPGFALKLRERLIVRRIPPVPPREACLDQLSIQHAAIRSPSQEENDLLILRPALVITHSRHPARQSAHQCPHR